eukprot:1328538-Pyramimonas_sp.AAC.1
MMFIDNGLGSIFEHSESQLRGARLGENKNHNHSGIMNPDSEVRLWLWRRPSASIIIIPG